MLYGLNLLSHTLIIFPVTTKYYSTAFIQGLAEPQRVKFLQIHLHIRLHIQEFFIGLPLGTTLLSYEYANKYANEFVTTSNVANHFKTS